MRKQFPEFQVKFMKTSFNLLGLPSLVLLVSLSAEGIAPGHDNPESARMAAGYLQHKIMNETNQAKQLPPGIWGGSGILLTVKKREVLVEYACASGEISGRPKMDKLGNFTANGFHAAARGGPVRLGEKAVRQPARYEGSISGNAMKLKVILLENNEVIGEFDLRKDATPRLHRCM